jgi:hypothetical protein
MSMLDPDGRSAVLVRVADAEVLGGGPATIRLLVDSDTTDGAIRANRTLLGRGADGPPPHYHQGSAESFFLPRWLAAGAGRRPRGQARSGRLPGGARTMPHAFAAPEGGHADVLIIFAPGVKDRFEYFRLGDRVIKGQASPRRSWTPRSASTTTSSTPHLAAALDD